MAQNGLGNNHAYVAVASGVHIKLGHAQAVTFYCYEDDGSQIVTLKESIDGLSEQNLAVITTIHKGPGIGGTWTKVTQNAAATYDNADDTVNDCISFTVRADQLSAGYNCVELTNDAGTGVSAVLHDLNAPRAAELLPSMVA
jgi:hypothetical protein